MCEGINLHKTSKSSYRPKSNEQLHVVLDNVTVVVKRKKSLILLVDEVNETKYFLHSRFSLGLLQQIGLKIQPKSLHVK